MVESAMEFLRICQKEKFLSVVISMKASNVLVMIQAYRMLVAQMNREGMNFPLHLGVTEAGEGEDGRIKSAVGIGALLADGIGDTIRVSLTEDPELEIPVAKKLVNYFEQRTTTNFGIVGNNLEVDPFQYSRRKTKEMGNIGSNTPPIVVGTFRKIKTLEEQVAEIGWNFNSKTSTWSFTDQAADFIYLDEIPANYSVPTEKSILLPYKKWDEKKHVSNIFPILSLEEARNINALSQPNFIIARLQDLNSLVEIDASNSVLIFESIRENPVAEMRACFAFLQKQQLSIPVILKKTYNETDMEQFQIKASCDMGALLADGLGDGIWIENLPSSFEKEVNATAFGILQATRTRISKTEYISCPSCGRTLFDLQATCAKIRERTNHLKGLKIGIMGCIVNGPGEMADADYGYVGAGPGRITLYKSKEVVKKNLNENEAVEELINLIKENGDWLEPV
jgi:(E)-4-hydroxy-3-methylbut-2-enyl-diphosphate synthase